MALDLCARLSTGRPMPDGSPSIGPANAIVIKAQDTQHDAEARRTWKGRLVRGLYERDI